jgi:hypothetical protein
LKRPILKQQEIPYDHPDSSCMFDPDAEDLAVAITPAAKAIYNDYAYELLAVLTALAKRHNGLDRLQIFMSQDPQVEDLWVEQGHDAIVFHLPSEH